MTDDEIIAVVQAHKEGKKIQYRERCAPQLSWIDHPPGAIEWHFVMIDYRVAPEPRKPTILALVYKGNGIWRDALWEPHPPNKVTRFMEVIE